MINGLVRNGYIRSGYREGQRKIYLENQVERMLEVGDAAPDFSVESTEGELVLSDLGSPVVLYFFPKAGSAVCTREACAFRDAMAEFNELDAAVVGVSPNDSLERLREFARENGLEFPLVSDLDGELSGKYDVGDWFGLYDERVTYVIGDGEVAGRVSGMLRAKKHVRKSLEAVRAIQTNA